MKSHWMFLFCLTTASAILWPQGATFWKNKQPSFTQVCLYSNDPSKFTPTCILCPNTLYPIVLNTCVKGSAVPLNVTYTQASCIVGNCAVNMNPKVPNTKFRREASEVPLPEVGSKEIEELMKSKDILGYFSPSAVEEQFRSVPYTMVLEGQNVTITSVVEYTVGYDSQVEEDSLDEELE